jgi:hypothetical protein
MKLTLILVLVSTSCWAASAHAVACNTAPRAGSPLITPSGCGVGHDPAPPPAMPTIGDTTAQIDANYPGIVIQAFETFGTAMDARIDNMEDTEVLLLALTFVAANGNQALLHQLAAQNLSAKELVRWQAAFGQAVVSPYVGAYSKAIVAQAYFSQANVGRAINALPTPLPPDYTMGELWTEFRIWQGQSVAGTAVSVLATIATKTGVGKAWTTGFLAGSLFYKLMVWLDPSFGYHLIVAFGGTYTDGTTIYFFPPNTGTNGQGYFTNADGSIYDGYGNLIQPATQNLDTLNPHYGDSVPPTIPDPFYFFPPDPVCLFFADDVNLECTF